MSDFGFTSTSVVDDIDDFAPTTAATPTAVDAAANQDAFGVASDEPTTTQTDVDAGFGFETTTTPANADPFGLDMGAGADMTTPTGGFISETKDSDDVFGLGTTEAQPNAQQQSKLAAWRAEHEAAIKQKQDLERKEKAKLAQQAQEELAAFVNKRNEQATKNASRNRADEKQWKNDLKNTMENGTDFEKVAKYCELRVKDEGKPPKNDRMRKLLIQLKNERPKV